MDAPPSEATVILNAEGEPVTASFRLERGAITVASGSVSTTVELRDVLSPQSIAGTRSVCTVPQRALQVAQRQVDSMKPLQLAQHRRRETLPIESVTGEQLSQVLATG